MFSLHLQQRKGLTIVYKSVNTFSSDDWYIPFIFASMTIMSVGLVTYWCYLIWRCACSDKICFKQQAKASKSINRYVYLTTHGIGKTSVEAGETRWNSTGACLDPLQRLGFSLGQMSLILKGKFQHSTCCIGAGNFVRFGLSISWPGMVAVDLSTRCSHPHPLYSAVVPVEQWWVGRSADSIGSIPGLLQRVSFYFQTNKTNSVILPCFNSMSQDSKKLIQCVDACPWVFCSQWKQMQPFLPPTSSVFQKWCSIFYMCTIQTIENVRTCWMSLNILFFLQN